MVEITIEPHKITAHGHAADDAGCAAVSAILYALAGALENLSYPGQWRIESGEAEIPIPDSADARALHLMAEVGLRQVAQARDDVRITDTRERPLNDRRSTHGRRGGKTSDSTDARERPQEELPWHVTN